MAGGHSTSPLDPLVDHVLERKASDLLLTVNSHPLARVDGLLQPIESIDPLTPDDVETVVRAVVPERLQDELWENKEIDFSFNYHDEMRFRVNVFHQRGTLGMALRLIPYDIPNFDDLGLPEGARRLVDAPHGLILVTGPTGSGKSTTLASMLDHINSTRPVHILTIEDPIEYVHRHKRGAVNQREVGDDTPSFARALRSALREDPDVLLIGEMRDLETIRSALTIAETGHLVLATLHTNDTSQAIDRIVDVFPGEQQTQIRVQLANTLAGVIYQQLIPRVNGGRVAAYEVLLATTAVRNLIKEGKTRQLRSTLGTSQRDGMSTLESSLSDLIARGEIDHAHAVSRSLYPNEIARG